MENKIKIIIIDDHKMVVEGISKILELNETVEIIGWAATGKEGLKMVIEKEPDIVLLDIGLPDIDGFQVAENILAGGKNIKIIILSMHSSYNYIVKLFNLGVHGYIVKDESSLELNEAISCVQKGEVFVSRIIADAVSKMYINRLRSRETDLTRAEEKVLLLMLDGQTIKNISSELEVTVRAVYNHKKSIFKKLHVTGETELLNKYNVDNYKISEGQK
jgi:DNA-binding NarL/FixJ family response regulator